MTASRLKLRDKAYDSFTERLLNREIKPGQFVSQRELVEMTGITLGAIRELIPRLEAEGLITTVPQRGMQVAHVDLSLIRNAFQFRLFLEDAGHRALRDDTQRRGRGQTPAHARGDHPPCGGRRDDDADRRCAGDRPGAA